MRPLPASATSERWKAKSCSARGEPVAVAQACSIAVEVRAERIELRDGAARCDGGLARTGFERLAHGIDLGEVARRQRRDDAAAPRQLDDEAFARQLAHRLANRPAARAVALGERGLVELRPRRDLAREDLVAQPVGDGLPELRLADGVAFLARPVHGGGGPRRVRG